MAENLYLHNNLYGNDAQSLYVAFVKGAEWADSHVDKRYIEKIDTWLRTHLPRVISNYPLDRYGEKRTDMLNEDMREELRKYMEEI